MRRATQLFERALSIGPGQTLRVLVERSSSGGTRIVLAVAVQRPDGTTAPTPGFTLDLNDLRPVAQLFDAIADELGPRLPP